MAETVEKLAYEEAKSAIACQETTLDGLRSRAGTLLAAASLVTSFLGGQVLAKPTLSEGVLSQPDVGTEGWIAILMFVGVAGLTLAILWPYDWRFVMGAGAILQASGAESFESVQGQLAKFHEKNYDANEGKLDRLFWFFRLACVLLVGETVAWVIALSG